uniref:Uncharacterized protein n=1 Tax=Hemiselmis tepida TaxID=464990 RepID=A0A7S0WA96_9CRYP|mmetsp:Transcript_7526/g.19291  ORF Transcript_7526/g.19291 Transcript_7526/m.19291 type:complete len:165 (+) Transcript_7526:271-765(+)
MASIGDQFSTGDQGENRKQFWESGFKTCPKCGKKEMGSEEHTAGCRMNGDGYGTEVFTCKACNWSTSFQYDEAAETYYYETSGWKTKGDVSGWGVWDVRKMLQREGITQQKIIDTFFKEEVDGEVLLRGILTRDFMMGHPKWALSEEEVRALAPVFKKVLKVDL